MFYAENLREYLPPSPSQPHSFSHRSTCSFLNSLARSHLFPSERKKHYQADAVLLYKLDTHLCMGQRHWSQWSNWSHGIPDWQKHMNANFSSSQKNRPFQVNFPQFQVDSNPFHVFMTNSMRPVPSLERESPLHTMPLSLHARPGLRSVQKSYQLIME